MEFDTEDQVLSSFGVELCNKSTGVYLFYTQYAEISTNYLKMSRFPTTNVLYPGYLDTNYLQLYSKKKNHALKKMN